VLPAGAQLGVQREHLLLLYTTLHGRYADIVDQGLGAEDQEKARRSGINLAALTLNLLRRPEAISKARRAPHPRVQQLLDQLDDPALVSGQPGARWSGQAQSGVVTFPGIGRIDGHQLVGMLAQADVARALSQAATGDVVQDVSQP
jgi:hypothetical protein